MEGTSLIITRQLEEEGVVRSNTTEARLIDRTTFSMCVSWQQIKNAPHRNCNRIAVAAHCGSSPFLQTSASSLSATEREKLLQLTSRRRSLPRF